MKLRNKINGGIAECDDELAAALLATPSWVKYDPKPEPAPEPAPQPARRGRKPAQKPVEEPTTEE